MWRRRLAGLAALLLVTFSGARLARAEGSAEFDARDQAGYGAHDQAVEGRTVAYVDIIDSNNEKVCWRGTGNLVVKRPNGTTLATLDNTDTNGCIDTPNATNGAYEVDMDTEQVIGTEWDIRVCQDTANNATCRTVANDAVEHKGRLWSLTWDFESNTSFAANRSANGSVFAIVPGGATGYDAVIEMRMEGVSGAYYKLFANATGPQTTGGTRVGRSAPIAGHTIIPLYPLYLSPPAIAKYLWLTPQVTNVRLTSTCGTGVVQNSTPGRISFDSNITGSYVVICDANRDTVYDFASATDWSSFGAAAPGTNNITWNGTNNSNAAVTPPGIYSCVVRLNVGEFHYIAQDIETSYQGIRMFRVELNKTKTQIPMFWDDRLAPAEVRTMPNGQSSPKAPPPNGLDPLSYATASTAFYYNGSTPVGNARAWGDFNQGGAQLGDGKGNDAWLDTFSAADFASAPFSISVITAAGDTDGDTIANSAECTAGTNPQDADTDDDGVNDNVDAFPLNPNRCRDVDNDTCDDCAITGANNSGGSTTNDGTNTDSDTLCDAGDPDDDNDGIPDGMDSMPLNGTRCADTDADGCDDCSAGTSNVANDGLDFDADGECDIGDTDDDNDGIGDATELGGTNLSLDSDGDGVPDWKDPQSVSCTDTAPPAGECDSLPASVDADGDGKPNQRDLDSDADGITDTRESGGTDANGDGRPDGCTPVNTTTGACASGLVASLPNTDNPADAIPDVRDLDSDNDGLSDQIEAYDSNGDGVSDRLPSGFDTDADGIDDAFDPSCAAAPNCSGRIGAPVTSPLSAARDANGDGTADWLTLCGDGYVTGTESCDDANGVNTDACSNSCRRNLGQACTMGTQCESTMCDGTLGTCQTCLNDQASGTDMGCTGGRPTCATSGATNSCVVCANTQSGVTTDDGCAGATPMCDPAQGGGFGACFECLGDTDCDDSDQCTTDTCTSGTCGNPSSAAGTSCSGGVCDGEASPSCIVCIDNQAGTTTDSGCSSGMPLCDESGATPACVECLMLAHCPDGEYCNVSKACAPGCASNTDCTRTPETPVCNTAAPSCVQCLVGADCPGIRVCGNFACTAPDSDGDGVPDDVDVDDDNDGVSDIIELGGTDRSQDSDDDGIPDYRDPDAVSCPDTTPADGDCDSLPIEVDADQDGVANHLDRDSDGDGLTDAREAGGTDANGDGSPDNCNPVTGAGACSGGLVNAPPNTDDPDDSTLDLFDLDSDGDGISDHVEAYDTNGDGVTETQPSGVDTDGDGVDDAFDPSCAAPADCGGVIGAPVVTPLSPARDSNDDDTADWLTLCGDAYVTSGEACDDGDTNDDNACSNTCLRGFDEACTVDAQCDSDVCDVGLGTCQLCTDSAANGVDDGCPNNLPTCATTAGENDCVVCADTQSGLSIDDGCSLATPLCNPAGASGDGACVGCLSATDCDDGNECTVDACTSNACSRTPAGLGAGCNAGVCNGSVSTPACVTCVNNQSGSQTDSGCSGATPLCDVSGGSPTCVECVVRTDCPPGDYCSVQKTCVPGCTTDGDCDSPTPICDVPNSACVECLTDDGCAGIDICDANGICGAPDSDGDGVPDDADVDDDNDGVSDLIELDGDDLSQDSDDDGIPDYRDPDAVSCPDTTPADGDCDSLPSDIDVDQDGLPNHLDRDADGDGITDTREAGGTDANGDGSPDACEPTTGMGACSGGIVNTPPNTDDPDDDVPDLFDLDSDGDGLSDHDEAYDQSGDGSSDTPPVAADSDGDGIDDAFDPDCAAPADCGGVIGAPVVSPLSSARDSNGDGTPDWLTLCGDAYVRGAEVCDDGDDDDDNACSNACLRGFEEPCTLDAECDSQACDDNLDTCQRCVNSTAMGVDDGCPINRPTCVPVGLDNECVVCADTQPGLAIDDGCSSLTPLCDAAAASGAGACVECIGGAGCQGVEVCTSNNTCSMPDSDGDGVPDDADADDDNDGVSDEAELNGMDLSQDSDDDGIPDYRDPDAVSCVDTTPQDGDCDAAPSAYDADGDGLPNHLDRDSDGDGITDAREGGSEDANGDGVPDGCLPVTVDGACASGLIETPPNTDGTADALPDLFDPDSDADGLSDHVEAYDSDGDRTTDLPPSGTDTDEDGIDDAFDPDCASAGDCSGRIGAPVTDPLSAARDANDDDTPDWLQRCGDAYVTSGEACDGANDSDTDGCTNRCLPAVGQDCDDDAACDSMLCDVGLGTCQLCLDDAVTGPDLGCSGATPACNAESSPSMCVACGSDWQCSSGVCVAYSCVPCADDKTGTEQDRGCSNTNPLCTGTGVDAHCVACLADGDCSGGGKCVANACQLGCASDTDCNPTPATPICRTGNRTCVQCSNDAHCPGWKICSASFTCQFEDYDVDGQAQDIDIDDDGDGILDADELGGVDRSGDADGDGIPDYIDEDSVNCASADEEGECTEIPEEFDIDRDGTPNHLDLDSDDDGVPDATEGHDEDLDGEPDREPVGADTDGDGLDDTFDADCARSSDCRGIIGKAAPRPDTDEDGWPNFLDADDDNDERSTREEVEDADGYGDYSGDASDIDGDVTRNWYDTDSDNDTALDITENMAGGDVNDDGLLDYLDQDYRATDTDGDGVLDIVECKPPRSPARGDCPDTDHDGHPDYDDPDDDGDGIPTSVELRAKLGRDVDRDGTPNYLDLDSDGDGILDRREANLDIDQDGIPDYLQKTEVGFAGGALCSLLDGPRNSAQLGFFAAIFGLCAALLSWRRSRARTRSDRSGR